MGDASRIEWTDATWNPVYGCTKVSAGCKNCYAEGQIPRLGLKFNEITLRPDKLDQPLRWKKPRRIFVNSLSDLFHGGVPEAFITAAFSVMASAPQHTFQVLTKRPERMRDVVSRLRWRAGLAMPSWAPGRILTRLAALSEKDWVSMETGAPSTQPPIPLPWTVPPNVWLGTSVEDQAAADERIPELLATPAAVRFLSCEPLLGPVDLEAVAMRGLTHTNALDGSRFVDGVGDIEDGARLGWVIVGGESGHRARPLHVEWARSIVEQCRGAGVPVFVKQLGRVWAVADSMARGEAFVDEWKGADPEVWPADLRVREMPEVVR